MRKLFLIAAILFIASSCEEIFHPEDPYLAYLDSYDELLEATGGVYGQLAELISSGRFYLPNIKGDDITRQYGSYDIYYRNFECDLSDVTIQDPQEKYYLEETILLWRDLYLINSTVNNILIQFSDAFSLEEQYRHVLGELYLIRAYIHFRLSRCFGRVPYITNCEPDYEVPLPEYDDLYCSIVSDLETAIRLLPSKASEARIPYRTPHRGSAKALLAELYLNWAGYPAENTEMYRKAAEVAGNLIDSAWYYEIGPAEDFLDMWLNNPSYNPESVFTIFFSDPDLISDLDEANHLFIGQAGYGSIIVAPDSSGIATRFFATEINFFNYFPESYRKDNTFFTRIYLPSEPWVHAEDTGYIDVGEWEGCGRPVYNKFFHDVVARSVDEFDTWWYDDVILFGLQKIYLFRFSHTLLTYAEAKARIGEFDATTFEAINIIRRRANNVNIHTPSKYDLIPGLSAEEFIDSVIWERAWEFAGEPEGRWFDLLRTNQVRRLTALRHELEGDLPKYPIGEDDYFFPIPGADITLNPNLQSN